MENDWPKFTIAKTQNEVWKSAKMFLKNRTTSFCVFAVANLGHHFPKSNHPTVYTLFFKEPSSGPSSLSSFLIPLSTALCTSKTSLIAP